MTAAHCVRPEFTNFSFTTNSATAQISNTDFTCVARNDEWLDNAQGIVKQFINARYDYAFIKIINTKNIPEFFENMVWTDPWSQADPYNFKEKIRSSATRIHRRLALYRSQN